jgi:hypothetical protein
MYVSDWMDEAILIQSLLIISCANKSVTAKETKISIIFFMGFNII